MLQFTLQLQPTFCRIIMLHTSINIFSINIIQVFIDIIKYYRFDTISSENRKKGTQ